MLFTKLQFLIFFTIVFFMYYFSPGKSAKIILLLMSVVFYALWDIRFIAFLFFVIAVTLGFSKLMVLYPCRKRTYLWIALVLDMGLLITLKYLNFLSLVLMSIFGFFQIRLTIPQFEFLLPIGISFYVFQSSSYLIDVYRDEHNYEKSLVDVSLFIAFFPQLTSGPISRAKKLIPQLQRKIKFNYPLAEAGLYQFIWGVFKKIVIADHLSKIADLIFNNASEFTGVLVILGVVSYTIQIYADFSGYSDMAIGISKMLGIDLGLNFNIPYFSKSIKEFWSRWHISLSTWFRDYLYIPMGGNRKSYLKWLRNILLTFLISGLWHGANFTFIIWGLLHGLYQVGGKSMRQLKSILDIKFGLPGILKIFSVFLLVSFAWIFFRSDTIETALIVIRNMFIFDPAKNLDSLLSTLSSVEFDKFTIVSVSCSLLILFLTDFSQYSGKTVFYDIQENRRHVSYFAVFLILWILLFGAFGSETFIYFKF